MNLWKKSKSNYSSDEFEKAEMLEAHTRWLNGEKLSRKQKQLLKASQEDPGFEFLKQFIDFAHYRFRETESVITPRPRAKGRIINELMGRIRQESGEDLSPEIGGLEFQPAYSIDPIGSDSELAYPSISDTPPPSPQQVDPFTETVIINEDHISEQVTPPPVESSCNLKLRITHGDGVEREYNVAFLQMIIGRGVDATIQLEASATTSRRHALLTIDGDDIHITDLGSGNGTYVDGVRISEPTPLQVGSRLAIGEQSLEVSEIQRETGTLRISFREIEGINVGQVYSVHTKEITIGRGKAARLRFSDSTGTLSRVHARLELKNGEVYITDLGSTNGTYVDGVRIEEPTVLQESTIIKLGSVICEVVDIGHTPLVSEGN